MALSFGFHTTLLKMGKFRLGVGYKTRGATAAIMACCLAFFYLMWYMLLAFLWICYGFCWLMFILPAKGIAKLIKNKKSTPQTTNKKQSY